MLLFSRFDNALMQPPTPQAEANPALLDRLRRWCEAGALPRLTQPLAVARIAPSAGLDGVACALDGSHELVRLGRWRGRAWRLQLLVEEQLPASRSQPGRPWDVGWWRAGPLEAAAAFRPRRATLLLVRESDAAQAAALLSTLRGQSPAYARPLRVLLASAQPVAEAQPL